MKQQFRIWCKYIKAFTATNGWLSPDGKQLLWLHTDNKITISNLDDGDYIVQMFTGDTDKNERKIFEGDIVTFKSQGQKKIKYGEVTMTSGDGAFIVTFHGKNYSSGSEIKEFSTSKTVCNADHYAITVVGNIFENANLLLLIDKQ